MFPEAFFSFLQQIDAEPLDVSGSVLSARYTKMPMTATQGLTGPMKRVTEVAGACLTGSKNKLASLFFHWLVYSALQGPRPCPACLGV